MSRILGKIDGDEKGPLIACVAGLHGNEQVGIEAFNRVFTKLSEHFIDFNGRLLGLAGNQKAIALNKRFIDYDLNRSWTELKLQQMRQASNFERAEDEELLELKYYLDRFFLQDAPIKILIDLHATSSENGNFIVIPEDESTHPVVQSLHQPVVVNLDRYVNGTMLSYYHQQEIVSFAFEGGLIGSPKALQLHEAGIWEILKAAGAIKKHDQPWEDHYRDLLKKFNDGFPNSVKVYYRHPVEEQEDFRMKPGYVNFQYISKGEYLADTAYGPLYSPMDGLIFMPLYQEEGSDGFFIVREV